MTEADGAAKYGFRRIVFAAGEMLPLATVAAVTASIGYNIVYLHFAKAVSITPITIADVFAKSWVIIPAGVLFALLNIIAAIFGYKAGHNSAVSRNIHAQSVRPMSNIDVVLAVVGLFSSSVFLIIAATWRELSSDNLRVLQVLSTCITLSFCAVMLITISRLTIVHEQFALPIMVYTLCIILFIVASMNGIGSLLSRESTIVRYGDKHVFCGKLISLMERGVVVYEPTYGVRKLIPTSSLKSIETAVACAAAVPIQRVPLPAKR